MIAVARKSADDRILLPRHSSSREGDSNLTINVATVDGYCVRNELPWLYDLYHNEYLHLAQSICHESVSVARNDLYGVVLNVQRGQRMRYEAHVDSNPIQGLFFATSHHSQIGGELVISNRSESNSVDEIDDDCSILYPVAGYLIFFDARLHPHYARALNSQDGIRVVAAMNFYTVSCPEDARPADLSKHLAGYQI